MRILLLILLAVTTIASQAQQITGFAIDETGTPIGGATVSLLRSTDSASIKLAVTTPEGAFRFSGINKGNYKISASHVGYQPAFSANFEVSDAAINLPKLKLVKISGVMNNLTITSQRPMVEVKADKMILNVEGTINAIGTNALELLRKSPGVLLDKDDNISMAGKNGLQVYVDGRSTPLSGADLANYLKSLQSSQVEAIELITNPSAKYDAAGNAGIINIRLKKNKSLGTNASINGGWNIATYAKYNAGASLNYRNQKVNIFSNYSFSYAPNQQYITLRRTVLDSLFTQQGSMFDIRKSHNFKIGADYFINKKNTIGVMVNGILSNPSSESYSQTHISNTTTSIIDRILVADNDNSMKRHNANINLNYSYTDPKGTSLIVNADRGSYDINSDQFQHNNYFDASGQVHLDNVSYHMLSPAKIHISSIKADYEQNFLKGKLGFGAKSAWVKTDNNFHRYNITGSSENLDEDRSNHFKYTEAINAAYTSYNRQYKKFMMQIGLRVENTVTEGISNAVKQNGTVSLPGAASFKRSYTDFFPSAAITFNKNPMKQWSLTYSRRIDRPAYQDLNPFEFKLDEYTFMKGNINLRPQYTNSFGLTHTYKYKLNILMNYSHVTDMFTQLIDTTEKSKAFVSKKNLATQDIVSISISYPFAYKSYSLFTSISSNYSKYKADFGTGRQVDLGAFGFTIFAQNSLKFAKTWTAELSGFFNAPTIYQGSFKAKSLYNLDAGISKQCLDGRLTMKASVSDIFQTLRFRAESSFAGQVTNFRYRQESRQFKLSFNVRLGNNGVKPARQRTTGADEETKRVQQGGGLMGN